jgi:2'-5' RNA ligase
MLTAHLKSSGLHDFSSTHIVLPKDIAKKIRDFAASIPDDHLAEDGREDTPHVTVKYGLHTDDVEDVRSYIEGMSPFDLVFSKVSVFPATDENDYDVVKVDVESVGLSRLNKTLSRSLDHTDTHSSYRPHATIAYVKAGKGEQYTGDSFLDGESCEVDAVTFSSKSDRQTAIRLKGAKAEKNMQDILIGFGSELKLLPNGHIGGHLVRFTDASTPDLAGDFFDAKTDFGFEGEIKSPVYLNHRLPLETSKGKYVVVKEKIGEATLKMADDGVVIDAILYERKKYEKVLKEMGWSSGTASHLSDRTKVGKSHHVDLWPLGLDASITPTPCDPNNICSLKSYQSGSNAIDVETDDLPPAKTFAQNSLATVLSKHIDDRVEDGRNRESIIKSLARESGLQVETIELILADSFRANDANLKAFARTLNISFDALKSATRRDYARTIKGMFEEALADNVPSRWQLDSIYCDLMRKIAATAQASSVTGVDFDSDAKIKEATAEYLSRLQSLAITQVNDYVESGSDEPFYLKAVINTSTEGLETDHLDLPQHSELVASAETGIMKRFRRFYETRIKAGRVLSDKTRKIIQSVRDNASQLVSDCDALLEETKPMASDEAMRAVQTRQLARRSQRRQAQLGA